MKQVENGSPEQRRFDGRSPWLVFAIAALIVFGGIITLANNDRNYSALRQQETQGQAEVLAESVRAAVDFGDTATAQEAVNAFRVNKQVRWVGVFDGAGRNMAGYAREGSSLPATLVGLPSAGTDVRAVAPVDANGRRMGTVVLQVQREALTRRVSRYVILGSLILLAALVLVVLGLGQARLRRANGELETRAEALAAANVLLEEQMAVRAEAEAQLRQAQKMQALGQLTGGIAHDFNNLLTVIQGSADMLVRPGVADEKRVRYAQAIVQASSNAAALTSQLLSFARRQPLKRESFDVNELIGSMRDLLDRTLGERIAVRTELCPEECLIDADRNQLQSAILNIASNARDAMPDGGRLVISTRHQHQEPDGDMVAIVVSDTGEGMDAETQLRVFEPFFTTKGPGKGTGLGLSQVYGLATQSGGNVQVASAPGEGTAFTILLPSAVGYAALEAPKPAEHLSVKRARILIVEDNDQVGKFAETLLSEIGHEVRLTNSAEDALKLLQTDTFDLVFSDIVMPGMGGLALSKHLAEEYPDLPVVLATGYSEEIVNSGAGDRTVILKPYRLATLSQAIHEALPSTA